MNSIKPIWNFHSAAKTIPYLRPLLRDLRESFILCWHFFKKNGRCRQGRYEKDCNQHDEAFEKTFVEIEKMGINIYDVPYRGIALFPCLIAIEDRPGVRTDRLAFFVYKDSRDSIDSFIFEDEFSEYNDLFSWERPVPNTWKEKNAKLTMTTAQANLTYF